MANKQGFKDTASNAYIYQEQTKSVAIGLDSGDTNKIKIVASDTAGATPTADVSMQTVDQASIVIDPTSGGHITIIPEDAGSLTIFGVYGDASGNNAGLMTISSDGLVGSTAHGEDGEVLIGVTGGPPVFSATPEVTMITITDAPTQPTDGANKAYVDAIASGFTFVASTRVATTADLGATYANGVGGVGATLTNNGVQVALEIDGVTLSVSDRVLVKDQTAQEENGIYEVTDTGSGATDWVLTRTTDYDEAPAEIKPGTIVPIEEGTVNAFTSWIQTETVAVIGTDPIIFIPFTLNGSAFLTKAANLSDVADATTSRGNLGITEIATQTTTNHAVIVGAPSNAITSLATGNSGQVLTSAGAAADPAFENIGTNSGLTNHGVLVAQGASAFVATAVGTTGQVLVGNTGGDPSWSQVDVSTMVTGILPIANGGTNDDGTEIDDINGVLYFDGTRLKTTTVGTATYVLTSNGVGVAPTFQPASGGGGGGTTTTTYNTPGSFTFNKQVSTRVVEVFGWAGGGGGGGGNGSLGGGGGGNGGAFYYKLPAAYVDAATTVVVGAGGAGGTPGNAGARGGETKFGFLSTGDNAGLSNAGLLNNAGFLGDVFSQTYPNNYIIAGSVSSSISFPKAGLPTSSPNCQSSFLGSMLPTGGGGGGISGVGGNGGSIVAATQRNVNGSPPPAGSTVILAGGAGGAAGVNGSPGLDGTTVAGFLAGGTGGGGGGVGNTTGGLGGFPGGGGGGGGRGAAGTGGAGGGGLVIVIEYA